MAKKVYFNRGDLSPQFTLGGGVVLWLLMDRLNAPGWLYGVMFTLVGVVVLICTIATGIYLWSDDHTDLKADDIERRLSALERRP